ncbi:MAG TPA: outer membrane protein assembly factor BamA [Pyrinomonadaceae bacterium]|jgi:outer membrane protein insertion porin family|nr:outer membrane protein assembly factor BamA [Pyrinomonadaceae bacterium]
MRIRAPWFFLVAALVVGSLALLYLAPPATSAQEATPTPTQASPQGLVEDVLIENNRRLRDEDILYHIQTRPGDTFNEAQVRRDLQALLNLPFFDKTKTSVATDTGPRGGVRVIFTVTELPIIRDIVFKDMKSVAEADVLKAFRENRIGVSKESPYDPVKVNNARRVIKELLAARGRPNAVVNVDTEEVSQTSVAITFNVEEGERVRVVEIDFEGNQIFKDGELRSQLKLVKEAGLISRFRGQDILDTQKLEYDLKVNVTNYMRSKGYLEARTGEPRVEGLGERRTGFPILPLPLLSSVDEALRVTVPVIEGKLYRLGELKIEGNSIFSEQNIRDVIGLKTGEVANGQRLYKALQEDLKRLYGRAGFIQYSFEFDPTFKPNPQNAQEGVADFTITVNEGRQFSLRRLEFQGNTFTRDNVLRREVALNEGDVFDQTLFEFSVLRLNQLGFFDPIDKDKDAEFRTDEERGEVDINLRVAERGRNQISFNGGLSGIGGSFFGLNYSTNNLLGRGESLSFDFAFGNRQRSFVFSFTEPYVKDRPISVGFSVFTESRKFFGEGTILSQNVEALTGAFGSSLDFLSANEENLFTQTSTGGSVFASAPLSEFYRPRGSRRLLEIARSSRIGLSYSISQSSIEDPPVNEQNNQTTFIPQVFAQPNITTSRLTPTFAYDTRNASIDPTTGRQVVLSFALAGLGGDVRTYQPTLSYTQFIPVRRKRSEHPEVFGFRLVAGTVGSFGITSKIREAQQSSLSFINGVPIYERFFLGDEFTIRGYNVRSISPLVPLDSFVTSRNVQVSTTGLNDVVPVEGLPANLRNQLIALGTFTGPEGNNSLLLSRTFNFLGGDTQLLGNFEYRIPIFGPIQIAAFADIGSAFNLRSGGDQTFSSKFLPDQPFLSSQQGLAALVGRKYPDLQVISSTQVDLRTGLPVPALVIRGDRPVTRLEFADAQRVGQIDPLTGLPLGMQPVFLRGEAQTNTVARLSQSLFSKIGDYRSSLGAELRIQLPVVNVPFRLIYAYNPNARTDFISEKKSLFRFSIGRTF